MMKFKSLNKYINTKNKGNRTTIKPLMIPIRRSCGVCFYGNYDKKKNKGLAKKNIILNDQVGWVQAFKEEHPYFPSKVLIKKLKNIRNYF